MYIGLLSVKIENKIMKFLYLKNKREKIHYKCFSANYAENLIGIYKLLDLLYHKKR